MKVKIFYKINVTEEFRSALAFWNGKKGKASKEDIRNHYKEVGNHCDKEILAEYRHYRELYTVQQIDELIDGY